MNASPHFKFIADLATAWSEGAICLPSFPDIVLRIRRTLSQDDVCVDRVVDVVRTDPALVSKLLVFANSAAYNPSGNNVETVRDAVSRLGFELVRSTAIALAVRQMFLARQHTDIQPALRATWKASMRMAAMCSAVADGRRRFSQDAAFLVGLLHYVGKLYILTRAKDYPGFANDKAAMAEIMRDWHPKVGTSVVQSWGFSDEIVRTIDTAENVSPYGSKTPDLVDVAFAAERMITWLRASAASRGTTSLEDAAAGAGDLPALLRLGIGEKDVPALGETFRARLEVVRTALAG